MMGYDFPSNLDLIALDISQIVSNKQHRVFLTVLRFRLYDAPVNAAYR